MLRRVLAWLERLLPHSYALVGGCAVLAAIIVGELVARSQPVAAGAFAIAFLAFAAAIVLDVPRDKL